MGRGIPVHAIVYNRLKVYENYLYMCFIRGLRLLVFSGIFSLKMISLKFRNIWNAFPF